ncbi:hypothetical protein [Microbacterium sp. CFBP9034]|uniref:hypothetical protein n=1 Tax=Microbacterium sp. CFBP9034 TaxID=3096540 RepID=UPI002A6AAAC0|nr:hypothetical protein [Microbacterium sp. CFBP9034]MDY0907856.1 hypothetical protein [Microbacterium sp. CFBP9034]
MADERSAWRANDIVTYDGVREAANAAIAAVLRLADDGAILPERAIAEASAIRIALLEVNAYDRSALDALLERFKKSGAAEYSGLPL